MIKIESGIDYKSLYNITSAIAVVIVAKDGLVASEEQTERILAFMYNIGDYCRTIAGCK